MIISAITSSAATLRYNGKSSTLNTFVSNENGGLNGTSLHCPGHPPSQQPTPQGIIRPFLLYPQYCCYSFPGLA